MNAINRQKFLAELAKLLTFMYEEDRQFALSMYERMFDIAGDDEQWLVQNLMSPTRQAVVIARAYNAKERKLSVASQYKDEDDYEDEEGTPSFVLAINKIFDDLFPEETEVNAPVEDQVSFFELGAIEEPEAVKKPKVPKAAVLLDNTQEFELDLDKLMSAEEQPGEETSSEDITPKAEPESEPAPELPTEEATQLEAESVTPVAEPEPMEMPEAEPVVESDEVQAAEDAELPVVEPEDPAKAAETETPVEPELPDIKPLVEEAEPVKDMFSFLPEEDIARPGPRKSIVFDDGEDGTEESGPVIPIPEPEKKSKGKKWRTESETGECVISTPLLVLFLIVAIPVTLALILLLAVPTAASLAAAVGLCALGAVLVASAFSGFAVLADILLLLGASIVVLALGLLLLWVAIWLIGSIMGGLVNSVRQLAKKWCSKEVPAE